MKRLECFFDLFFFSKKFIMRFHVYKTIIENICIFIVVFGIQDVYKVDKQNGLKIFLINYHVSC